jgi:hypothetical protein
MAMLRQFFSLAQPALGQHLLRDIVQHRAQHLLRARLPCRERDLEGAQAAIARETV